MDGQGDRHSTAAARRHISNLFIRNPKIPIYFPRLIANQPALADTLDHRKGKVA
jgi:hypothetical protein